MDAKKHFVGREGDGIDPRDDARCRVSDDYGHGRASGVHQQARFIAQVQVAIDCALQTAAAPILNALSVHEVVKERGALHVVLVPRDADVKLDTVAAAKAVAHASSMIRREVASAITRKETPEFRFTVLPAGAAKVGEAS
jgi:ribosome-binding factor A